MFILAEVTKSPYILSIVIHVSCLVLFKVTGHARTLFSFSDLIEFPRY